MVSLLSINPIPVFVQVGFFTDSNMGNKKNKQRAREGTKRRLEVKAAQRL
jgi:hypothetical protein